MSDQLLPPSAGLKALPTHGGPNLGVLARGDLVTPLDEWQQVRVISGAATGAVGWLLRAATGPVGPSGLAMPGDVPGWHQVFRDDFTTPVAVGTFPSAVKDTWTAYLDGWPDTSGHGVHMPSKVLSVSDHCLRVRLHREGGKILVATAVPIIQPAPTGTVQPPGRNFGVGLTEGRYSVCARIPKLAGYKTAWLLWPDVKDNYTPPGGAVMNRAGEIDWPEANLDATTIGAYMHRPFPADVPAGQDFFHALNVDRSQWHVYTTERTAHYVRFYLDGALVGESTAQLPTKEMHYDLQTETALSGPLPDPTAEATVEIDWIVAYATVTA